MSDKAEFYRLVAEFRAHHWSASDIAEELRISTRWVQQAIADMRQPPTPRASLPYMLLESAAYFAKRSEVSAGVCVT